MSRGAFRGTLRAVGSDFDEWVQSLQLGDPEGPDPGVTPVGTSEFLREVFDTRGPVSVMEVQRAWDDREDALARHAVNLFLADVHRTTMLRPTIKVWRNEDGDLVVSYAGAVGSGYQTPALSSIRPPGRRSARSPTTCGTTSSTTPSPRGRYARRMVTSWTQMWSRVGRCGVAVTATTWSPPSANCRPPLAAPPADQPALVRPPVYERWSSGGSTAALIDPSGGRGRRGSRTPAEPPRPPRPRRRNAPDAFLPRRRTGASPASSSPCR